MAITLALRIAEWRQFRGMEQHQVAALADITRPRYSDIERGKAEPKGATLQRIAKALDCTPSQLYDDPSESVSQLNEQRDKALELLQDYQSDGLWTPIEDALGGPLEPDLDLVERRRDWERQVVRCLKEKTDE